MIYSYVEREVTPKYAAELLRHHNKGNRKILSGKVRQFASDMNCGRWIVTHQGICLDKDGNIIDGQHRLSAVVLYGKPVRMMVAIDSRSAEENLAHGIDIGKSRTLADATKLPTSLCALSTLAARLVYGSNDTSYEHRKDIARILMEGFNNLTSTKTMGFGQSTIQLAAVVTRNYQGYLFLQTAQFDKMSPQVLELSKMIVKKSHVLYSTLGQARQLVWYTVAYAAFAGQCPSQAYRANNTVKDKAIESLRTYLGM